MEIQKKVFWNFFFFGGKAWKFIEGGATRGFLNSVGEMTVIFINLH